MLTDEQLWLINNTHERPTYDCAECCAPDINPEKNIQLEKDYILQEVICRTCWEEMDWEYKEFLTGEFDEVIEP